MSDLLDLLTVEPATPPPPVIHACSGPSCGVCALDTRPGRARATDPATSHTAADSVAYRSRSQKARLLAAYGHDYYGRNGEVGLTDDEAALRAGLERSCFWKRCGELRADGMIADTGTTRRGPIHGEPRMVCIITAAGRAVLA
jgi:hypothetical protein